MKRVRRSASVAVTSGLVARGIWRLQFEAKSVPAEVRPDTTILGDGRTVEQHVLDADVIVEPFEMPEARDGAGCVKMKRRCAMAG